MRIVTIEVVERDLEDYSSTLSLQTIAGHLLNQWLACCTDGPHLYGESHCENCSDLWLAYVTVERLIHA
jgi:hypothetical protein